MNSWIEAVMLFFQDGRHAVLFFDVCAKSIVLLALAGGVCALWWRAAAATRHFVWFAAVLSLLCLPVAHSIFPSWQEQLWTVSTGFDSGNKVSLDLDYSPANSPSGNRMTPVETAQDSSGENQSSSSRKLSAQFDANWLVVGSMAWAGGAALILLSVAAGQLRLRGFSREASKLRGADWQILLKEIRETLGLRREVILLRSDKHVMPLTWGWWRPVVLLPAEADIWPVERRRIVLLHELAHVKRMDCLTQTLAQIVCAIYWFNPLVWIAAKRMRVERESACDDLVLSGGCRASDYAGHLVEIAETFRRAPQVAAAIAMARPSGLEQRVAAIVDASRTRRLGRMTLLAVLIVTGGTIFFVGGCKTNVAGRNTSQSDPLRREQIARLEEFSKLKLKQSQLLAAAAGETISPEYQRYFDAAIKGDSQTVTNMYESFKKRHPQYGRKGQHNDLSLRTSYWSPVLEISLAYDHVVRCEPKYTQIAVDDIIDSIPPGSIYFGGTDPGRGLPTAFSKSQPDGDPFYTLTQNALADGTYLEYLQNTYGERARLLKQLGEARRSDTELRKLDAQWPAALKQFDSLEIKDGSPEYDTAWKAVNELREKRDERATGITANVLARAETPAANGERKSIYTPAAEDSQKCFQDYVADVTQRLHNHQLKPGEEIKEEEGRIQISGQVAVMAINGLLTKIIFDKNPGHEFFIEESFPLDWMYPHLEPHGLIMKINRQPLTELSAEVVRQDQDHWQKLVAEMIGGWLNADTSVQDVTGFAERVFARHDLGGFTGDPRFVQNDYACRLFSKLRSSIAGLYAWRAEHGDATEKERMTRAADLAFRQAFALCPYSPETANRYATFLRNQHRDADAELIVKAGGQLKSKSGMAAIPAQSIFQVRLVLDNPASDSEAMPVVQPNRSGAAARQPEMLNVAKTVLLDQTAVRAAKLSKNRMGYQEIEITLNDAGREQFAEITRANLHKRLAIVIDGRVWTAPTIQSEISGGKAVITGSFSEEEAKGLTAKINEAVAAK